MAEKPHSYGAKRNAGYERYRHRRQGEKRPAFRHGNHSDTLPGTTNSIIPPVIQHLTVSTDKIVHRNVMVSFEKSLK
ncbi:hypothetical protein AC426_004761 [Salmonella enterica subsp. enterica]|nr:hypothetical protein [Salmonella enterica subsp. enterica]